MGEEAVELGRVEGDALGAGEGEQHRAVLAGEGLDPFEGGRGSRSRESGRAG